MVWLYLKKGYLIITNNETLDKFIYFIHLLRSAKPKFYILAVVLQELKIG